MASATGARRELNIPGQTVIVHSDGRIEGPMTREAAIEQQHLASSPFATLPEVAMIPGVFPVAGPVIPGGITFGMGGSIILPNTNVTWGGVGASGFVTSNSMTRSSCRPCRPILRFS